MIARVTRWLTISTFGVIAVSAVLGNELRSQDVDPQYARVIVDRTIRYGGSFYKNGIHNKGPLEPFVYLVASWFTTSGGFWYAISLFIALGALLVAWASAFTARFTGASRDVAIAVAAVVFVHLTLSGADYAGVLYARNMIVVLLAAAWLLTFADRPWTTRRRAVVSAVVIGGVLGLAVQTLLSTAFTAGVLLLVALLTRPRMGRLMVAAAAATFFTAPLYYGLRGSWTEFWEGWWVQARYMNVGTGRSLGNQLALGLHQFGDYYQRRPLALLIVIAFVAVTAAGWRDADTGRRVFAGGLIAWFAAAWIELALSQRYSSHYFVVSTVPTALIGAALAGHVYRTFMLTRRRPAAGTVAWPLVAVLLAVFLSGTGSVMQEIRAASTFTSPRATELDRDRNLGGEERATWAVLDLVSHDGDPLLTWSNEPWPYLKYHRVAATRFIWKSFLMGEIYLGRTSQDYVLPHAWTWFAEDIARTRPVAFIETNPRDKGTPFDALITDNFTPVLTSQHNTVYLRADVARHALDDSASTAPSIPAATSCMRLDGDIDPSTSGEVRFQFTDTTGLTEPLHLAFDGKKATAGSDFVDYLSLPVDPPATRFALLVGRRAAALVLDGKIRAALRLPPSIAVTATTGANRLHDVTSGPMPKRSGC